MKLSTVYWLVWILVIILFNTVTWQIQASERRTAYAYRTATPILVDGQLNEPGWLEGKPISNFVQQSPNEGDPASEQTVVRVLFDAEQLYVGFECLDSQPDQIVANEMKRDGMLWQNDNVYLLIDPYGDKRSGFFFRTNALGAQADSAVTDGGHRVNGSWDCVWQTAGRRHDQGWTVEMAIPFDQLRFREANSMLWGINFGRNIMRTNESTQWMVVPQNESWPGTYRPIYAGQLVGLEGIPSPAHLSFKPYTIGGLTDSSAQEKPLLLNAGLDAKYGISSNLTLDLTANTDFAQVEADREEVNLTRFNLYFPEKREFFLEGSGRFAFGADGGEMAPHVDLFYSRRIGLYQGNKVPILGGGKMTGKVGAYSLGLLNLTTTNTEYSSEASIDDQSDNSVPRTNFSVLRVQRDILSQSNLGLILTNRQSSGSDYQRNGGLDLALRLHDRWRIKALLAGSLEGQQSKSDLAWYLEHHWANDWLRWTTSFLDIGPDFTSDLGFVPRRDIRALGSDISLTWRPNKYQIRSLDAKCHQGYLLNHQNQGLGSKAQIGMGLNLDSGDGAGIDFSLSEDVVEGSFSVGEIEVSADTYQMKTFALQTMSAGRRPLAVGADINFGDYYQGRRIGFGLDSKWRMSHQLSLDLRYNRNQIHVDKQQFQANVAGARLNFALNTRFFMKLYSQWNDARQYANLNFLLRYIYRPGSDFYLVYDQRMKITDSWQMEGWTLLTKLTYYISL